MWAAELAAYERVCVYKDVWFQQLRAGDSVVPSHWSRVIIITISCHHGNSRGAELVLTYAGPYRIVSNHSSQVMVSRKASDTF